MPNPPGPTVKLTPQPSSTPAPAVPKVGNVGGAVRDALTTGKADKASFGKNQSTAEERDRVHAEAQKALEIANERLKPGAKHGNSFAEILMEEMRISMDIAKVWGGKLYDKGLHMGRAGSPVAWAINKFQNRESQHKLSVDDVCKAVKVDDQGRVNIAETVSLPFKGKYKDVPMSKEFQMNAQNAMVGFFQEQGCEVVETKDAQGKGAFQVYEVDQATKQRKATPLSKTEIEAKLGADKEIYKAALETAKSSPSP